MIEKRVAFVVQRFGKQIIGGAETHAYKVASRLKAEFCHVEIFTTTSLDYLSWDGTLSEGSTVEDGLTVHRFKPVAPRHPIFRYFNVGFKLVYRALYDGWKRPLENIWFRLQGPAVPDLIDTLEREQHRFSAIVFFTYLYYPTVYGLPRIKVPTILVPTAHDEFPFTFKRVKDALSHASYIFANTDQEIRLILEHYPHLASRLSKVGIGVDTMALHRDANAWHREPIRLLYLGRIGYSKSTDELIECFQAAQSSAEFRDIELRLAGPADTGFPLQSLEKPSIKYLGVLTEEQKALEMQQCSCVVNPSRYESMSMLVLEAINAEKPVLVQTNCPVLEEYANCYNSVYGYKSSAGFALALRSLRKDMQEESQLNQSLKTGSELVKKNYSWRTVLDSYKSAIAKGY